MNTKKPQDPFGAIGVDEAGGDGSQSLVGQFFHSTRNGVVEWQGQVLSQVEPGFYLVQLFEWAMGEPNVRRVVKLEAMVDWLFYPNEQAMVHSWEHGVAREGGPYRARK